jgi:hypothetical protein
LEAYYPFATQRDDRNPYNLKIELDKTIKEPVMLNDYETRPLTLREECRLSCIESKIFLGHLTRKKILKLFFKVFEFLSISSSLIDFLKYLLTSPFLTS